MSTFFLSLFCIPHFFAENALGHKNVNISIDFLTLHYPLLLHTYTQMLFQVEMDFIANDFLFGYICNATPRKPGNANVKIVSFYPEVSEMTFSENISRRLSSGYYRGLMKQCDEAQKELYKMIQNKSGGLLAPLYDLDDPIKIVDPQKSWDEDESPILFLKLVQLKPGIMKKITHLLNSFYHKNEVVIIPLDQIKSFPAFLTLRFA
jgi:hypothetical protein